MDATWSGRRRTRALPPSVGCHPTCPSAHHSPHTPHPPTHHRNTYSNDDSWAVLTDQKEEEKFIHILLEHFSNSDLNLDPT